MQFNSKIISSLFVSLFILVFATTYTNQSKYHLPFDIKYSTLSKATQKQVDCLAENILFEAGHETREGQVAVALVTLNRVASGNYAGDVCGVVKQKVNGICQFSWVCEPMNAVRRLTMVNTSLYTDIRSLAIYTMYNYETMQDVTKGATYYHADYVNPGWNLPKTTKIGNHVFYKKQSDIKSMNKEIKL